MGGVYIHKGLISISYFHEQIKRLLSAQKQTMKKAKEPKTTGSTVTQQHKTPSPGTVNGKVKGDSKSKEKEEKIREMERAERERLVLWRAPLKTLRYFTAESFILLYSLGERYEHVIYREIFNAQNLGLNIYT